MSLLGRFVSISGSAGTTADRAELARCHAFVAALASRILERGGGLTETLGKDPLIDTSDVGTAQTFFWTAAQAVLNASGDATASRPRFRVICNADKLAEHVPPHRRALWDRLLQLGLVDLVPTGSGIHTGGEIRALQVANLDALVLIGGGKGAHHLALLATASSKAVIPLYTSIGSANGDGEGSVAHYRLALRDPARYLRAASNRGVLARLSLQQSGADPIELARDVIELLEAAQPATGPVEAVVLTVVPVELAAALALVGIDPTATRAMTTSQGTTFFRSGPLAIACVGAAGNAAVGAVVGDIVRSLHPRVIVLAGIAGGDAESTSLGDVVIAEQVIGYEPGAVVGDVEPGVGRRPIVRPLDHEARQFLSLYLATSVAERVRSRFAAEPFVIKLDPVATGEKLVRSGSFFSKLQAEHHTKIRAVEMEALGFVESCSVAKVPHFVVRGISDHANAAKCDEPQARAARNAVAVAFDLCEVWLRTKG